MSDTADMNSTTNPPVATDTFDVGDVWRELVSAALLGTDRRDPPSLPPSTLADVVADAQCPDPARRLATSVATVAAVRRAAFTPLPPLAPVQPPPPDPRPTISPRAAAVWRRVITEWPVLDDEFMLRVIAGGQRLSPEVAVAALVRQRRDPVRRTRVARAAGPVAAWLDDQLPAFRPSVTPRPIAADTVDNLPELPIPPALAELLTADAHTFTRRLAAGFDRYQPADRPVLINLLARCRHEVLAEAAAMLDTIGSALGVTLADLARTRDVMIAVTPV